jgi:hypothetical protein
MDIFSTEILCYSASIKEPSQTAQILIQFQEIYCVCGDDQGCQNSEMSASAQSDQDPCCSLSVSALVIELVKLTAWILIRQAGLDPYWSQTHYVGFVMTRLKLGQN